MPNRRRRPLQDEGRKDRQDFRQRAEHSRTQRERIETHRERRERRREAQKNRRTQVASVRSPKEDLRTDRWDSRLLPVEDSFFARPVGQSKELPVVIGERWELTIAAQSLANATFEDVEFDTAAFTTERNGYPALYDTSTRNFTIPGGLAGIWGMWFNGFVSGAGTFALNSQCEKNGSENIAFSQSLAATGGGSMPLSAIFKADEGDSFKIQAAQYSGGPLDLVNIAGYTHAVFMFLGK